MIKTMSLLFTSLGSLNVYAHLMKETNQEAVMRLENFIFEPTGHHLGTEIKKDLVQNG
jgi:hypothetical protein